MRDERRQKKTGIPVTEKKVDYCRLDGLLKSYGKAGRHLQNACHEEHHVSVCAVPRSLRLSQRLQNTPFFSIIVMNHNTLWRLDRRSLTLVITARQRVRANERSTVEKWKSCGGKRSSRR